MSKWSRRFVTNGAKTAAKQQLKDLMNMNETNETELLLLTPLTAAPTPVPPTPAPTPIPQDVVTDISLGALTESAAAFAAKQASVIAAFGFDTSDPTVKAEVEYKIETTTVVDPAPSDTEAKAGFAGLFSLPESSIDVEI